MTQIGFFPTPGEHITFEKPKHTEWTIIAKLNEKDAFYEQNSTITPALLAINEHIQDKQGFVPGGYVIYIVFQHVPGVRLADDTVLPGWRSTLHTFFQAFSKPEQDQIRMVFDKEYRKLNRLGRVPSCPWATNLIWNPDASKL
ncbi:hypothetical protein N7453_004709 [Penicillium expansum]|nr:hypothetical protein N7453_004709 [Penicillium expansum]